MSAHKPLVEAVLSRVESCEHESLKLWLSRLLNHESTAGSGSGTPQLMDPESWLEWARHHPQLKVISSPVPPGILSTGHSATLHDVRISCYGPDDGVYDNDAKIRNQVARGNCFLSVDSDAAQCVVYGLKKFTGGLGDDDDKDCGDNHTWHRYFTKPLEEVDRVICTDKANGEAAHFSVVRLHNGEMRICAGSKNVHMLINTRDDISLYTEDRYNIASVVCHAVMDMLKAIQDKAIKQQLLEFLSLTKLTGVFELLNPQHQHVENLSHLDKATLRFITWQQSRIIDSNELTDLCCVPPHVAIQIAKAFRLPAITYTAIQLTALPDRMTQIRRGYNYEGEVLYFLDKEDTVIGLLKKKTIWYILCRAIREKTRNAVCRRQKKPDGFMVKKVERKIENRVGEIQEWLGIDDLTIAKWKVMGVDFLRFCIREIDAGTMTTNDVADMFPVCWKRFLTETNQTDQLDVTWTEADEL